MIKWRTRKSSCSRVTMSERARKLQVHAVDRSETHSSGCMCIKQACIHLHSSLACLQLQYADALPLQQIGTAQLRALKLTTHPLSMLHTDCPPWSPKKLHSMNGACTGNANIDATAKKSADAAGPTVPPTTEGYIASEVGPSPAQAESWRSH